MAIFTHVTVGTNDLAKARSFYDAVLTPLGLKRLNDLGENGSIWGTGDPEFFVLKPANGQAASHANGGTVSFVAQTAPPSPHSIGRPLPPGARTKGRSGRAAGSPTPMPAMSAIWTATSSPPIASRPSSLTIDRRSGGGRGTGRNRDGARLFVARRPLDCARRVAMLRR